MVVSLLIASLFILFLDEIHGLLINVFKLDINIYDLVTIIIVVSVILFAECCIREERITDKSVNE